MSNTPHYWLALHPDIKRPIGGVKQMHRLAEALSFFGRQATIIQESADFHPGWFSSDVTTISHADWLKLRCELRPERDVVVLPETYLNVFESYAPGLPKILFNQNGAYSFGRGNTKGFPSPTKVLGLYRHPELIHVICVSQHDRDLLRHGFDLGAERVSLLVNGIETDRFHPALNKKRQIAYMPRKNEVDASVVVALLQNQPWFRHWTLVAIKDRSQADVAAILQQSLIFLAFGHPEGFGLPMAEALACGCALLGYSGLGGRELFALAFENDVGLEVAYGDWLGFINGMAAFDRSLQENQTKVLEALLKTSKAVRARYATTVMCETVGAALQLWESRLASTTPHAHFSSADSV